MERFGSWFQLRPPWTKSKMWYSNSWHFKARCQPYKVSRQTQFCKRWSNTHLQSIKKLKLENGQKIFWRKYSKVKWVSVSLGREEAITPGHKVGRENSGSQLLPACYALPGLLVVGHLTQTWQMYGLSFCGCSLSQDERRRLQWKQVPRMHVFPMSWADV